MFQRFIYTVLLIIFPYAIIAQGHIDHIKNQEYLKYKNKVDCNAPPSDNLSERICANLQFQKADSLLTLVYDSLLLLAREHHIDSLENKITTMQTTWRQLRDQHCAIIYDNYKDCGGCHLRSIVYMKCLTALTEERIKELRSLKEQIAGP